MDYWIGIKRILGRMNYRRLFLFFVVIFVTIVSFAYGDPVFPEPDIPVSGTLPVCHVNTQDGVPVVDKDKYLKAELWIDPMGHDGVEPFGSKNLQ